MSDISSYQKDDNIASLYNMILGLPTSTFILPFNLYDLCFRYNVSILGALIEKVYFKHDGFGKPKYLKTLSNIVRDFNVDLDAMVMAVQKNGTIPIHFSSSAAQQYFRMHYANTHRKNIHAYNHLILCRYDKEAIDRRIKLFSAYKRYKTLSKVAAICKISSPSVRYHIIDGNRLGLFKFDIKKFYRLSKLRLIKMLLKYTSIEECAKHCGYSAAELNSLCKQYNISHEYLLEIHERSRIHRSGKAHLPITQKLGRNPFVSEMMESYDDGMNLDPDQLRRIHRTLLGLPFDTFIMPGSLYQDCLKRNISNIARLIEHIYYKKGSFDKRMYRDFLDQMMLIFPKGLNYIIEHYAKKNQIRVFYTLKKAANELKASDYEKFRKNIEIFNQHQINQMPKDTINRLLALRDTYVQERSLYATAKIYNISHEAVRLQLLNGNRLKLFDLKPVHHPRASRHPLT